MDIAYGSTLGSKRSRKEGICSLSPICRGRWSIFKCSIYSLLARLVRSIWGILRLNAGKRCLGTAVVGGGIGDYSFSLAFDKEKRYTFRSALPIHFRGCYDCSNKSVLQFTVELRCLYRSLARASWATPSLASVSGVSKKQAENVFWFSVASILAKWLDLLFARKSSTLFLVNGPLL